jgi:hypothetical protein
LRRIKSGRRQLHHSKKLTFERSRLLNAVEHLLNNSYSVGARGPVIVPAPAD